FGGLLGCALRSFSDDEGRRRPGATRLYRILISESTYLIWNLRNERVIRHRHSDDQAAWRHFP
ncbi:uncharacterized protein LAESUDRAFT_658954, partial [Laetiporus sulphureus 93-53]